MNTFFFPKIDRLEFFFFHLLYLLFFGSGSKHPIFFLPLLYGIIECNIHSSVTIYNVNVPVIDTVPVIDHIFYYGSLTGTLVPACLDTVLKDIGVTNWDILDNFS